MWNGTFFQSLFGVKHDDVIYIPLPLYHAAGLIIGFAGAIERGKSQESLTNISNTSLIHCVCFLHVLYIVAGNVACVPVQASRWC